MSSSTSPGPVVAVMRRASSPESADGPSAAGQLVAGLFHGGPHGGLVDRGVAGHGERTAGQVDVHTGDVRYLADLLGHRVDAVAAGHADDGVGGGGHGE